MFLLFLRMRVLTAAQCRAARALLDWSQEELARRSEVAKRTVAELERGAREPYPRTLAALRATLEAEGVVFIDADAQGGPGVRLATRGG